jgi:methionyl aminopeptidase
MRAGGKILARILKKLSQAVEPGITTGDLEEMANKLIAAAGGRPSFRGYKSTIRAKAFPTALCTSINSEVVHAPALPARELKEGDIIGIDIGMEYPYSEKASGYYTDMAVTVPVGKVSPLAEKIINVTKKALKLAIKQVKPGNTLNDIGRAVQEYVEGQGFFVVRDLVGHGVGTAVHEDPQVPNYEITGQQLENVVLKPGMTIAIEPMVNVGTWRVNSLSDGFTIVTADGKLSAHFEHTVAVIKNGYEVITAL